MKKDYLKLVITLYCIVLIWFEDGSWDMVHVEDWFGDITNGLDEHDVLQYTKWYLKQPVTHWAYVNTPEDLL